MKLMISLVFVVLNSLCFAQSELIILELADGTVFTYSVSEINNIDLSGSQTSIEEQKFVQTVLNSFILHQNYPNPFNPSTNISYEIPYPELVEINIYDIQGKLIYSFGKIHQSAGIHAVRWDGRNNSGVPVSSGTYFCCVNFHDNFLTKKLLLVK